MTNQNSGADFGVGYVANHPESGWLAQNGILAFHTSQFGHQRVKASLARKNTKMVHKRQLRNCRLSTNSA